MEGDVVILKGVLNAVFLCGDPDAFEDRLGIGAGHGSETDRADALRRRDVGGRRVIVDADVEAHGRRIKLVVRPVGVGFGLVANRFQLNKKWNHREVRVDPLARAGMRGATARPDRDPTAAFVSVDGVETGRFADDAFRLPVDELAVDS